MSSYTNGISESSYIDYRTKFAYTEIYECIVFTDPEKKEKFGFTKTYTTYCVLGCPQYILSTEVESNCSHVTLCVNR